MRTPAATRIRVAITATLAVLVVLVALATVVLRLAVAAIPEFRADIEAAVSETLGRDIEIGGLRTQFQGLTPVFVLEDVILSASEGTGRFEVEDLSLGIAAWASLRAGKPRISDIELSGIRLTVIRRPDDSLDLVNLGPLFERSLDSGSGDVAVTVRDLGLVFVDAKYNQVQMFDFQMLRLRRAGEQWQAAGRVILPAAWGGALSFHLHHRPEAQSELHLNTDQLALGELSRLLSRETGIEGLSGSFAGDLWLRGSLAQGPQSIDLDGVLTELASANAGGPMFAERIAGHARWLRDAEGWNLQIDDLAVTTPAGAWPQGDVSLRMSQLETGMTLSLGAAYLRLDDLTRAVRALPWLPETIREPWLRLAPGGEVSGLSAQFARDGDAPLGYHLTATAFGVRTRPFGFVPGVSGLNGRVDMDERGGRFRVSSSDGELRFDTLFREPIPFQRLGGSLVWHNSPDYLHVWSENIRFHNEDGEAWLRFAMHQRPGQSPLIDLRAHVENGVGERKTRYYPAGVMPPDLVRWMDKAIIGGRMPRADVLLYGPIDRFPFDHGEGVFRVEAEIEDGQLRYLDDWPAVAVDRARLIFDGRGMRMADIQGQVNGVTGRGWSAEIDDVMRPLLRVQGQAAGDLGAMAAYLADIPLSRDAAPIIRSVRYAGDAELDLQVTLPILALDKLSVDGVVRLRDNGLRLPYMGIDLRNVRGNVRFSERGVSAERLQATLRGRSVAARIETDAAPAADIHLIANMAGAPADVFGEAAVASLDQVLYGATDWRLETVFPGFRRQQTAAQKQVRMILESSLQGLALRLPAPMDKTAVQTRFLRIEAPLGKSDEVTVDVRYSSLMRALLQVNSKTQRLLGGDVVFQNGLPEPVNGKLRVRGEVKHLDVDGWLMAGGGEQAELPLPRQEFDLRAGSMTVMGRDFDDVRLQAIRDVESTEAQLAGEDLAGIVVYRVPVGGDRPRLSVDMDRVRLHPIADEETAGSTALLSADGVPETRVAVDELWYQDQPLGTLTFELRHEPSRVELRQGRLSGPLVDADFSGSWEYGAVNTTRLQSEAYIEDIGALLEGLGVSSPIVDSSLAYDARLEWPTTPFDTRAEVLGGAVNFRMDKGKLAKIDPGAGRLLGLVSLTNLPRRLTLDFSDVVDEGFGFDEFTGRLRIKDGNITTRDTRLSGPAAEIIMEGRIGLADEDYDQIVSVRPRLSGTLPIIGGLTAGPVGVVTAWVAEQVLQKQIDKITEVKYQVSGSWSDPDIRRLQVLREGEEVQIPEGFLLPEFEQ